jgi:hypothetical protein
VSMPESLVTAQKSGGQFIPRRFLGGYKVDKFKDSI